MKIYYCKAIYDKKEINASLSVLKSKSLTLIDGPLVKELEKKISKLFGKKYALMVNSGSSANLLAVSALTSEKLGSKKLVEGDEVLTVDAGFPTTINPIYQNNLIPVYVDVELNTGNIDCSLLEKAY